MAPPLLPDSSSVASYVDLQPAGEDLTDVRRLDEDVGQYNYGML